MEVRCPHCHTPISLSSESPFSAIACPSCGSSFSLLGGEETMSYAGSPAKTIGHFTLLEQIGAGNFGSVWRARDTELDRIVAVKIPRKDRLNPAESEQFLREARAAAQLRHSNIVSVHEVGRENETIFIVNEYVEGVSLAEWLTAHKPSVREAAGLCAKIADALHHAHEAGVIHRDLKPGNIMLDKAREPHVMDFGLARREVGEVTMTVEGKILGTPAYMSPEQARGEGHHADRRSDVYSLGAILFELLTGEKPFRGTTRMLLHQVLNDEAPSPRTLNGSVPKDLETVCLKCLEKDPHRRYASAKDLGVELRRFLDGKPIHARPVTRLERAWRWCKRNAVVSVLATGFVIAVLGGLTGVTIQWLRAEGARAESDIAHTESETARATLEEQTYTLGMSAAFQAWQDGNMARLDELLDQCRLHNRHSTSPGFEWRFLRARYEEELPNKKITFDSDVGWVMSLACSSDGKYLAMGKSGAVELHEWATGERLQLLAPDNETPKGDTWNSVCFSRDSRLLVAGGGHWPDGLPASRGTVGRLRLWEFPSRRMTILPVRHEKPVGAVAISPDGRLAASVSFDGSLKVWSLPDGKVKWEDRAACPTWRNLAFSPDADSRLLAAVSGKGVNLWDIDTGRLCHRQEMDGEPYTLAFSHDGNILATGNQTELKLWNVQSRRLTTREKITWERAMYLEFSPDDKVLAAGLFDSQVVKLWDIRRQRQVGRFVHTATPQSLVFSPNGKWLATTFSEPKVNLWDLESRKSKVCAGQPANLPALAVSPDNKTVAASGESGSVLLRDTSTNTIRRLSGHAQTVFAVVFSGNGSKLASTDGITIKVWDVVNNSLLATQESRDELFSSVALSPDGQWLAAGNERGDLRLWHLPAMELQHLPHQGRIGALRFSPDSLYLASSGSALKIWSLKNGTPSPIAEWKDVNSLLGFTLAFSPDGTKLAAPGAPGVCLWDWTRDQRRTLHVAGFQVGAVALSPDGQTLVAASPGGEVKFWTVASGDELGTLKMNEAVRNIAIFPDGHAMVTASTEGILRVWRVSSGEDSP